MSFSEKVSEHGSLREVAQTGAPQEVARGAVMEQTGGTEEGARIQMSNTFLENRKKKIPNNFGTVSSAVRGTWVTRLVRLYGVPAAISRYPRGNTIHVRVPSAAGPT